MVEIILSDKKFYRLFTMFFGRNAFQALNDLQKNKKNKKENDYFVSKLLNIGLVEKRNHSLIPRIKVSKNIMLDEETLLLLAKNLSETSRALLIAIYLNQDGCLKPSSLFREISRTHIMVRRYFAPKEIIGKSQTALWYNLKKLISAGLVRSSDKGIKTTTLGSEIVKLLIEKEESATA
ncbi:MAG: hypothetical protein ACP5HJ_02685 [Candidatus Micrarchaeia archaeon]